MSVGTLEPSVSPAGSAPPTQSACIEGKPRLVAGSEWFEGTCYGWRVGAEDVLGGDAYDRNLHLDCTPAFYGSGPETSGSPPTSHPTDLDLQFASIPEGATVEHVAKWACGTMGLSDHILLTEAGGASVDIARWLEGTAWLPVSAIPGSVMGCDVLGLPAVCIDDTVKGSDRRNGFAYVFVLEDRTLDPHGVVLRLYSEDVQLAELMQIASSLARA
jgi:hypothetical protein